MERCFTLIIFYVFMSLLPLCAEVTIVDSASSWKVGIAPPAFGDRSILFQGLFDFLIQSTQNISHHYLSSEEEQALKNHLIRQKKEKIQQELASVLTKRSQLFFSQKSSLTQWQERRSYNNSLQEKEQEASEVENYDPNQITIAPKRAINFVSVKEDARINDLVAASRYAKQYEFDQLIYMKITEIDDFYFVSLSSYVTLTEEHAVIRQDVLTEDEVLVSSELFLLPLAQVIEGRSLALLSVRIDSEEEIIDPWVSIYFDGTYHSFSQVISEFVPPGEVVITLRYGNGVEHSQTIVLKEGEIREVFFPYPEPETNFVTISSEPAGSSIFLGSVYVGLTPLSVPRPSEDRTFRITQKGFADAWLVLNSQSNKHINVNLHPLGNSLVSTKRKKFYNALVLDALSLPLPFLFDALYQDRAARAISSSSQLSASEIERNIALRDVYAGFYYGSLSLTLILTGYMVYRLVDYIQTANRESRVYR